MSDENYYWLSPTESIPEDSISGYEVMDPEMNSTIGYVYVVRNNQKFVLFADRDDIGPREIDKFDKESKVEDKIKEAASSLRYS